MFHECHPTLHGRDIGVGIGVRDIFDPHVSSNRSFVECVPISDKCGSARDFGDDCTSRKIRHNMVFVMITNGKR